MGVAMAVGSQLLSIYGRNRQLEAQGNANVETARGYIKAMNFNLQTLTQQAQDNFDSTIAELQKIKLQGNRQVKSVDASVAEGLAGGGRTADMIRRSARADVNRATESSKDNYQRKLNEILLNKEAVVRNARAQISSIKEVEKPNLLADIASIATAYIGAKQTQESLDAMKEKAGIFGATNNQTAGFNSQDYNLANMVDYSNIFGVNPNSSMSNMKFDFSYKNPLTSTNSFDTFFKRQSQSLIRL